MSEEALGGSLQEAVLAVLAFDDKHGAAIASQVSPEHFDGVFNQIAGPVLAYRARYGKAPGKVHLESLFSRVNLDPSDRKTHALRRVLVKLAEDAETLNGEYVSSRAQDHVRAQRLKSALLRANERYTQGGEEAVAEVEAILSGALRFRAETLDAGVFLNDLTRALSFTRKQEEFYALGVPQLDRAQVGMFPKQLLLYLAQKGSGKTWFCVHCGRQAVLQKAKVVHISLEMDEDRVLSRYYQSFFAIARTSDPVTRVAFEVDDLERLTGLKFRRSKPKLDFADPAIRSILRKRVSNWGSRFERLVVKKFPAGTLTINQLRGYLDYLERVHGFIPNVLIVDYPMLMKMDADNLRASFGKTVVDLRGLSDERNLALVAPAQSNRSGMNARRVDSRNLAEDISQVFTADTLLSYSQTPAEKQRGLARLLVEHTRDTEAGLQLLLTQSYATGQYFVDSAPLGSMYWDLFKDLTGEGVEGGANEKS